MSITHTTSTGAVARAAGASPSGRTRATRIIAGFMATSALIFGAFTAVFGLVAESQQIHSFHNAVVASLLIVLSAPAAVAIARRPERSESGLMVLTALSIAAVVTMVAGRTADPFTLPFVVLTAVLWTIRPAGRVRPPGLRPSPLLLGLVLAASVPMTVYALDQAELQRTLVGSDHTEFFHWVEASFYAAGVLLVGLLAAMGPARYRLAAVVAGLGLSILGVASLLLSGSVSSFSSPWAWAAVVGGAAFVAIARFEAPRHLTREERREPLPDHRRTER